MKSSVKDRAAINSGLRLFGFTLLGLFVALCVVSLAIPVLAPARAVNFYRIAGLNAAAVSTQKRIYEKSNKIEDLYNLVLLSDEVGDKDALLEYSNQLLSRDDFNTFAAAYEEYALKNTEKDKLYLVASLKNYLMGIRIEYLYSESAEKAFAEAVKCFDVNEIAEFYFSKYVSCVLLDESLTAEQKNAKLVETASSTYGEKTIVMLLQDRYNTWLPADLDAADILLLEQLWQTKSVEVMLLEAAEDVSLASAKTQLEQLSNALKEKLK